MLYIHVPVPVTPVTVRMADLVSECNVVSAVHSYVPVPVTCNYITFCTPVRMADLVSECNVVSAVHSYVPVPVTYL